VAPASEPNGVEWDRYLSRLPEPLRLVVMLFYFEDRSIGEVARMLGVAEGTVNSQLHRARRALADMME
jgi:RNA polymerase sigma-70 factor (ECF subfamily)